MKRTDAFLSEYLLKLGFDTLSSKIYLELIQKGPLTILALSRNIRVERTKIYRQTEDMIRKGILQEVIDQKRKLLKAINVQNLVPAVQEKQADARYLIDSFPLFNSVINSIEQKTHETQVLYYRGKEGIQQMLWNELNAEKEMVGFTYRVLDEVVGIPFFRKWAEEYDYRKIGLREIRTEEFYKSLKEAKTRTVMATNQIRYISSRKLPIKLGVDIYNDVTAMYDWKGGEVFGIEIYNQKIADMHKHFFELYWSIAKPDKIALSLLEKRKRTGQTHFK